MRATRPLPTIARGSPPTRRPPKIGSPPPAKSDLDKTRTALAGVEAQRTKAVADASDAARRRSEAEAAATDATRRRSEAEAAAQAAQVAATDATKRKSQAERDRDDAEVQRQAALAAARSAQLARDA